MITDCPECRAKIDCDVVGETSREYEYAPIQTSLLECPVCRTAIVVEQELLPPFGVGPNNWSDPNRVWPEPTRISTLASAPGPVRYSLKEAEKCMRAGANTAAVVMYGRALEGLCRHFSQTNENLKAQLKELKSQNVIDIRLMKWGEQLWKNRCLAAHPDEQNISLQDAQDVEAFTLAICEYVFYLTDRFDDFMARQGSATN